MLLNVMKGLALLGVVLNAILLFGDVFKKLKTPEGQETFNQQKKFIVVHSLVGFFANFFDTLGIGSYAPSSSAYKITKSVDDINVPGTLNVGDTIPVCLEAFLFFTAFNIDPFTCFSMCLVATVGAYFGASIVSKWDRTKVRWGFGIGLFVLAVVMLARQMHLGPFSAGNIEYDASQIGTTLSNGLMIEKVGEDIAAIGLRGPRLIIALVVNCFLGAMMCLGVGLYAPCMALCVLVGLHTGMAFPLMMGSCAYLMAFGNGPKFIKESRYDISATITNAIFGAIGVFVAYFIVKSMDLKTLTWVVICVCFLTSILYLKDAMSKKA